MVPRHARRAVLCLASIFLLSILFVPGIIDVVHVFHHEWRTHGRTTHIAKLAEPIQHTVDRYLSAPMSEGQAVEVSLDIDPRACPAGVRRFGNAADGGWDMCLDALPEDAKTNTSANNRGPRKCVVYSFGISDDSSFDEAIVRDYANCDVYAFDPTIGKPTGYEGFGPRIHFYSIWLGAVNATLSSPRMTLSQIMAMLGHDHIDVLKMDVESSEWEIFRNWEAEWLHEDIKHNVRPCPPFAALSAELHFPSGDRSNRAATTVLRRLRRYGFVPFSRLENWRYCKQQRFAGTKSAASYSCLEVGWILKDKALSERCFFGHGNLS